MIGLGGQRIPRFTDELNIKDGVVSVKLLRRRRCKIIYIWIALLSIPIGAKCQTVTPVIHAIRVDGPPTIDGELSEGVWKRAEIATHFFRAEPVHRVPAKLNTEAMVLYDEDALYVGVRCDEPKMNTLRETKTRRDASVWHDDAIELLLDTYHDRRNCYIFAVNTLGTQMDEKISNESIFDLSWDAKWKAKIKKNGGNWTAEIAIPFRELRFDSHNATWGINFWRAHPIDGESYSWSDIGEDFGRVSEFGKLTGLDFSKVKTDRKLGILPYLTHRTLENQPDDTDGGLDLIIPISTNLTSNLTYHPDFSQLESDPTQINISSDRELFLPERRPFFREGTDLFELPLNLFYTRRVQEIDFGVKTTGKVGDYNFAVINAYGNMVDRYDADEKKQANLFASRINRDIGKRTVIGVMGIQKHQADRNVTLLSLDGRFALHRDWAALSQYAVDWIDGEPRWAYHASVDWRHEKGWGGDVRLEDIQDGFRPNEVGLEDEAFRKRGGDFHYTHKFAEGRLVKSLDIGVSHFYQTNAQKLLRERRSELFGEINIGKFDFFSFGGVGAQREEEQLFDTKFFGSEISYQSRWGRLGVFNQLSTRQEKFNRFTSFSADVNLFGKFTVDLNLDNFFWREHRNTLIFRLSSNYQFTQKIGWRIFLERVDERLEEEIRYNFNSIFDYEFTPESHFFFVFVDSTDGERAVFTKLSYLFESGFR